MTEFAELTQSQIRELDSDPEMGAVNALDGLDIDTDELTRLADILQLIGDQSSSDIVKNISRYLDDHNNWTIWQTDASEYDHYVDMGENRPIYEALRDLARQRRENLLHKPVVEA